MQRPAAPGGGLGALLARLGPGDHGLVFGPTGLTPGLVEALLDRTAALDFELLLAPSTAGGPGPSPGLPFGAAARVALAGDRVRVLDRAQFAVLRDAVAQHGLEALVPMVLAAEERGRRGVLMGLVHGDAPAEDLAPFEAALAARLPAKLAVQCIYPGPPAAREPALRLLRAHTPGRMVMPSLWRVAERGPLQALATEPRAHIEARA